MLLIEKAAQQRRTPKRVREFHAHNTLAFWSAAVLRRFSIRGNSTTMITIRRWPLLRDCPDSFAKSFAPPLDPRSRAYDEFSCLRHATRDGLRLS
jgi:hypothetical protein